MILVSIMLHQFSIASLLVVVVFTIIITIVTQSRNPNNVHVQAFTISFQKNNSIQKKYSSIQKRHKKTDTKRYASSSPMSDEDIQNQLTKARKLLEKAKAKVAAQEQQQQQAAAQDISEKKEEKVKNTAELETMKRKQVIKSKSDDTGLITTDGELMAELSEEEDWEVKSLMDVFQSESTRGRHDEVDNGLANRDVAASIFNLRMQMMDEDYRRIFNKQNRFIGEDN